MNSVQYEFSAKHSKEPPVEQFPDHNKYWLQFVLVTRPEF